jgi:hypothetical protein
MKSRLPMLLPLILGGILAGLLLLVLPRDWTAGWELGGSRRGAAPPPEPPKPQFHSKEDAPEADALDLDRMRDEAAERILALLGKKLNDKDARDHEALLNFKDEEAYRAFLDRAAAAGLKVLDQLDGFRTVRVGYGDLKDLQKDLLAHAADYGEVGANYIAYHPGTPPREERAAQNELAFGDGMLGFLGVTGDHSQWGKGVTVAILDSGVASDAAFGTGRLRYLDIGQGLIGSSEGDGHGTAVGYLAAGDEGIAPGASLLSIKVTGADGTSDLFTLAKGIRTAVDSGAQIINISLGAYENSSLLTSAITYASARGVMIVAPSGNDQAAQMTYPAADSRVVSVGAVDALGQQATFSNSGQGLKITAPGYGLDAAWLNGERVSFDGTSGSSPIVAGSIAAIMSESPGLNASQAWAILQQYTSDGGAPGADNSYGSGILNLGWAMNRNNTARVDTAVSSHYYNNQTGQMEFVVQNRSGTAVSGLTLNITGNQGQTNYTLPVLNAGASTTISVPVNQYSLSQATQGLSFRSQLINPTGVTDAMPSNNQKASTVSRQ